MFWGSGHQESLSVTSLTFHVATGPPTATLRSLARSRDTSRAPLQPAVAFDPIPIPSRPVPSHPIPSYCFFHTNAPALPAYYTTEYSVCPFPFVVLVSFHSTSTMAGKHTGQNRTGDGMGRACLIRTWTQDAWLARSSPWIKPRELD